MCVISELTCHLNKGRRGSWSNIGESAWFLEKTNGPLEKQMGEMRVCSKVCLGVVSTSRLLSCDRSPSSLVDGTQGRGHDNEVPFGGSVLGAEQGVLGKSLSVFGVSQGL